MKETFRMWKIARFLRKNEIKMVIWDTSGQNRKSDSGNPLPEFIEKLIPILEQTREPRIARAQLVAIFGIKQKISRDGGTTSLSLGKVYPPDHLLAKKAQQKTRDRFADAQVRINNCISENFISRDNIDDGRIYLTLKGRKFGTVYGLIKEWILEDIGRLWSVIGTAIVVFGAFKFDWLIGIIKTIIDKIF